MMAASVMVFAVVFVVFLIPWLCLLWYSEVSPH